MTISSNEMAPFIEVITYEILARTKETIIVKLYPRRTYERTIIRTARAVYHAAGQIDRLSENLRIAYMWQNWMDLNLLGTCDKANLNFKHMFSKYATR